MELTILQWDLNSETCLGLEISTKKSIVVFLCLALYILLFLTRDVRFFIKYSSLEGHCKWILIQPLTQVLAYSLSRLKWFFRLRIGLSHLSISGIVVYVTWHGSCYISHCFYFSVNFHDCLLVDLCFLILFSCLLFLCFVFHYIACLLSNWSLNLIIVYYMSKLLYSKLFLSYHLIIIYISIVNIIIFLFSFSIPY